MDDPQQYPPVTDNPDWMSAGNFTQEPESLSTSPSGFSFADQRFGAFVFVVAITATIIVVFAVFLREFYYRKYGLDPCPGYWRRRRLDEQLDADRQMAEELQRRLNEEEREEERLAKRKERRVWYETFIKDYTMVSFMGFPVFRDTNNKEQISRDGSPFSAFRRRNRKIYSMPTKSADRRCIWKHQRLKKVVN